MNYEECNFFSLLPTSGKTRFFTLIEAGGTANQTEVVTAGRNTEYHEHKDADGKVANNSEEIRHVSESFTILLAEDDAVSAFLVSSILRKIYPKINVQIARNGKQALQLFKEHTPDLIFMDIHMPEMNGYETTEAIRKMEYGQKIPIIAVTASVAGDRHLCFNVGMDDFIRKPVVKKTIIRLINKWLFRYSST